MSRESAKSVILGILVTAGTAGFVLAGSRNLQHFDAALVGYTFAVLFAVFAITYRYSMWLQRPPTALYWKRGWQVFFHRRHLAGNLAGWFKRVGSDFALNRFIFRRHWLRGSAHWLLMWGCVLGFGITVPLTFGWIHFETLPGDLRWYRAYLFGFPTVAFPIDSLRGVLIFHALVFASFLVIIGVMLAMRRRMRDHGAASLQQFGEDFLPLILLFAISVTGLMLTASYTWLKGYAYDFLAILHSLVVILTLLWLPFGKFFHIFQRPAQLGVSFYKDVGERDIPARCHRCGDPFTSQMHLDDLIAVEKQLGYRYEIRNDPAGHYQRICPRCRRTMLVLAQGRLWQEGPFESDAAAISPLGLLPQSSFGNPGSGFGPLGEEDRKNFHP